MNSSYPNKNDNSEFPFNLQLVMVFVELMADEMILTYLRIQLARPSRGFSESIGIWKCWFLRRGENRSTWRKTSRSKDENQQQTQAILDAESGNRHAQPLRHPCSPNDGQETKQLYQLCMNVEWEPSQIIENCIKSLFMCRRLLLSSNLLSNGAFKSCLHVEQRKHGNKHSQGTIQQNITNLSLSNKMRTKDFVNWK